MSGANAGPASCWESTAQLSLSACAGPRRGVARRVVETDLAEASLWLSAAACMLQRRGQAVNTALQSRLKPGEYLSCFSYVQGDEETAAG